MSTRSATLEFLMELIHRTKSNPETSVSMYEIGAALGLEKAAAGKLAEEVIAEGWAEIKTLSGAIGVTTAGIRFAAGQADQTGGRNVLSVLGHERVIGEEDRRPVEELLGSIQASLKGVAMAYPDLEELVVDVKTARVQLLSPKPKTAVLREILLSLQQNLAQAGAGGIVDRIADFITHEQ